MNTETKTNGSYPAAVNHRMALPPFTDVHQDEQGWFLVADLPGVAADKLTLTVEDGRLLVVGKRRSRSTLGPSRSCGARSRCPTRSTRTRSPPSSSTACSRWPCRNGQN